jgi:hypothetical protein
MNRLAFLTLSLIVCTCLQVVAQVQTEPTEDDKKALEGIIVEKYYICSKSDIMDTTGGKLQKGSVTYRIFVDLKPGYTLQAVYGSDNHPLRIGTTTNFFNNTSYGEIKGDYVDEKKINENTVALDSWVTIGAATQKHYGIPKQDDKDGSIITNKPALEKADGLLAIDGKVKPVIYVGVDIESLNGAQPVSSISTTNGSWAVYGGAKCPTEENKLIIAQLTTTGQLFFELNIQVGTPSGSKIRYVAKNPEQGEVLYSGLSMIKK